MSTPLNELDVIFISYDEDNCEENYADLLTKVPWAKRVHGVKGSDEAHKAAAMLSETDRFISVDGDNIVDPAFFDQIIDFEHSKFKGKAISWSAKNAVNGLEYGNGGLKCWPVEYVMKMQSHEQADSTDDAGARVDFCWDDGYVQMNNRYCTTYPNGSPRQAFRAGFREGVKMTLDRGLKVVGENFKDVVWHGNLNRLNIWMSVGADVEYGVWAIYGARLGCYMTNLTDWDYVQVRDFEYINVLFSEELEKLSLMTNHDYDSKCLRTGVSWSNKNLLSEIARLGSIIRKEFGLEIAELDDIQSKFFKANLPQVPRIGNLLTESEYEQLRQVNK